MANNELKPCPFCGGTNLSTDAYSVQPDNFHSAYVECDDCEARGSNALKLDGWLPSKEEAISAAATAWNRRAAPAQGGLSDALRSAGAAMANVMFNMAQKTGYTLTSDDTALFDKLRKEWDSAVRGQQCGVSDAADAARYRWLVKRFGVTALPCFLERDFERGYIADGKESIDAAIDAAIQAQAGEGAAT